MPDTLLRAFGANLRLAPDTSTPDARLLEGRLVPYGETADVVDEGPDGVQRYREAFQAGAFSRQVAAATTNGGVARRIAFYDQHHDGLGKVGHLLAFDERPDGLYGTMRVLPRYVADVETMLSDGVDGLSVGFVPLKTMRLDGVRVRTSAHLVHVALEALGAYESARVLALRAAADEVDEVEQAARERQAFDDELAAWLAQADQRNETLHERLRA